MKAAVRTRLVDASQRQALGGIAPIATPFVLIVDPASTCNFRCKFCPTGDHALIRSTGRFQGAMKFEVFQKLIDDLEMFPSPVRVLRLYKEGEPLMNKRLPDMIAYAKQSKKVLRIDTTTNGALLRPKLSEDLISAGIDQINISVNGMHDGQFKELVDAKVQFDSFVENIRYLHTIKGRCEIYVKCIYENFTESERQRFLDTFGEIADRVFMEHLFQNWPEFKPEFLSRQFEVAQYGGAPTERSVCPYIFYTMTVNSDGTVSCCVQDWARKLVVGSLHESSARDIWLGQSLNAHRHAHLRGCRKNNPTCADCGVMSFGVHDDLDGSATLIEERLVAGEYH
jgi:MoaA/NifB/PqqE/SkfB family radical SAM enzyme